jgi:hypothetical protein
MGCFCIEEMDKGKLAPQRQRDHFVPTLGTPVGTRAMPIGRNGEAERTHEEFFGKYRMRRITPQRYYFISVLPTFFGALLHLSQREKSTPHRHLPLPPQKGGTRSCGHPSKTSQLFVKTQRLFSLSPLV